MSIQDHEKNRRLRETIKWLNEAADVVLAYKPKPKTKAAKRRIRRNKRKARTGK